MPRIPILNDQSVTICDTLTRRDPSMLVIRAYDATTVFWSQDRGDLDGNLDQAGNPQGGIPIFQNDPPLVLTFVQAQIWARAGTKTFLFVELLDVNSGVYLLGSDVSKTPPVQPRPVRAVGALPDYQESWWGGRRR